MPAYVEFSRSQGSVLVEIDPAGSGVSTGGALASFLASIADVAATAGAIFDENAKGLKAEIRFGVTLSSGATPVIVLDETKANFRVRVTLDAMDPQKLLGGVAPTKK